MADNNPFLRVSLLPYQAPQFDLIDDTHYRPAFDEGVRRQRDNGHGLRVRPVIFCHGRGAYQPDDPGA